MALSGILIINYYQLLPWHQNILREPPQLQLLLLWKKRVTRCLSLELHLCWDSHYYMDS